MSGDTYATIPDPPATYSAPTVLSRFMDGLGFRYHWATEGLTREILDYRPEPTCRSVGETLAHIHNIVDMVEHSVRGERYSLPEPDLPVDLDVRSETLAAISRVSAALRALGPDEVEKLGPRFRAGDNDLDFPFWNTINGTMSDALYHVGQVVAYRRAAGHPIDARVNVFLGAQG